jgi:hypothetical protein
MNFFGHAAITAQTFRAPTVALPGDALAKLCAGSMLPDFLSMLGLKRPRVDEHWVQRGVDFHHATDHAFHDLPAFHALSRQAFTWLSERDLPRGPARAVAHIGVEMLLDEAIAEDAHARASYRAALDVPLVELLVFVAAEDAGRLASLTRVLAERAPASAEPPAPELLAERIHRTLARRPRLATDARGQQLLVAWVTAARPVVAVEAPQLFRDLRAQLAGPSGAK